MKQILMLIAACGFAACVTEPPERDLIHCLYPGDTIALGPLLKPDSTIVACIWTTEIKTRCYSGEVQRLSQATTPCVEGTKWKGF